MCRDIMKEGIFRNMNRSHFVMLTRLRVNEKFLQVALMDAFIESFMSPP